MLDKNNFTKKSRFILALFFEIVGWFFVSVLRIFSRLKKNSKELQSVKKILVLRDDGIGDALLTLPLLQSLKELYSESKIDMLIKVKTKELLEHSPLVNRVVVTDDGKSFVDIFFTLKKEKYDMIISPRADNYIFHHFLSFVLNGKRRIGYAHKGGAFFLTDVVPWKGEKVIVDLLLDIGKYLGNTKTQELPKLFISDKDEKFVDEKFRENGIDKYELRVGINPSAGHPFLWPTKNWIEVIEELKSKYDLAVIFMGDKKSVAIVEEIQKGLTFSTYSLAGKTTLSQTAAIIKRLNFIISVDSAIRHIANTFNKNIIVLRNGANSNLLWWKYCDNEYVLCCNVPCSPCGKKFCPEEKRICMTGIKPNEILSIVSRII